MFAALSTAWAVVAGVLIGPICAYVGYHIHYPGMKIMKKIVANTYRVLPNLSFLFTELLMFKCFFSHAFVRSHIFFS